MLNPWELLSGLIAYLFVLFVDAMALGWNLLSALLRGERKFNEGLIIEYVQRCRSDLGFMLLSIPLWLVLHLIGYDPLRK